MRMWLLFPYVFRFEKFRVALPEISQPYTLNLQFG